MSSATAMHEDTLKVGLLMESAQTHQTLVEENLQRLQAHIRDLDSVVRDEIRRTLIEELQAVSIESKNAAQALRRVGRAANLRQAAFGVAFVTLSTVIPIGLVAWTIPSQAEIQTLRAQRVELSANILRLNEQGGRLEWRHCGADKRLCVRVERKAPAFGERADFFVVKGY
jgi:hypothetical protein